MMKYEHAITLDKPTLSIGKSFKTFKRKKIINTLKVMNLLSIKSKLYIVGNSKISLWSKIISINS